MKLANCTPTDLTLAATFEELSDAHEAVTRLKQFGFTKMWVGIARNEGAQTRVESENWFERMFGEGDETFDEALVRRGVAAADIPLSVEAFAAVIIVTGDERPDEAANILTQNGGTLVNTNLPENDVGFRHSRPSQTAVFAR